MNEIGSVFGSVLIVFGVIYLFIKLVQRARKGNRGIAVTALLLLGSGFVPDPNMEKQLKIMQEEKRNNGSEDESGDPPDPDKETKK